MPTAHPRPVIAALCTLVVLQVVMLSALYAGIRPHPPEATPLFGMGPFIGASVSAALAAMILGPADRAGRIMSVLAAVLAAISFGPQKYFDAQFPLIWPAVIAGQAAILKIAVRAFGHLRGRMKTPVAL